MATRLLPDPVGVDKMTFAPDTISMRASSWCGYSASPRRLDHPAKASKTASGSGVAGSKSVSVIGQSVVVQAQQGLRGEGQHEEGDSEEYQQQPGLGYSGLVRGLPAR